MDWNNPTARLALIERVGIDEYNRLHAEHMERSIVKRVGKYAIRPVVSARFGRIFMIDGSGPDGSAERGYRTIAECEAWIAKQGEAP